MSAQVAASDLITVETAWWLGGLLVLYVVVMYAISFWVRGRIADETDYIVAGRRLPLLLSWATLMATWFGAGTMLTAADAVRVGGLRQIALEPLGAGFCLMLTGFFFARRLWKMSLLTLPDFFRRRFGERSETLSAFIMVPSFFGWIAVQFIALAEMLHLFFGVDLWIGILLVAVVGGGYTWVGGMWSVTLTDALQMVLILAGCVYLGLTTFSFLGGGDVFSGVGRLIEETPPEMLTVFPAETWEAALGWLGVFCIAALGNIASQDLTQRVFAARSPQVAQRACWLAGAAYIGFGMIPVTLGLASNLLFPEDIERAILPALAHAFLGTFPAAVFTLALVSAILSTIDSAILAPAAVLAQNIFARYSRGRVSILALTRFSVILVTGGSLLVAYLGESAYSLLEDAYAIPLVGLLVPLTMGLYGAKPRGELPALVSMGVGTGVWFLHYVLGWESFLAPWLDPWGPLPVALTSAVLGLLAYLAAARRTT